ncbi:hypothetical protein D3C76_1520450 [compost metagenome]
MDSPFLLKLLTFTWLALLTKPKYPGKDKQASAPICSPFISNIIGLISSIRPSPQSMTIILRRIPTCGAARPARPLAAYNVSPISSSSFIVFSFNSVTGLAFFRKMESPKGKICFTDMFMRPSLFEVVYKPTSH